MFKKIMLMLTTYSLFLTFDNLNSVNATNNNIQPDVFNSNLHNETADNNAKYNSQGLIGPTLNNDSGHTRYNPLSNTTFENDNINNENISNVNSTLNDAPKNKNINNQTENIPILDDGYNSDIESMSDLESKKNIPDSNLNNQNENIPISDDGYNSDIESMLNNAQESVNLGNVSQGLIGPTLNNDGGHTQYDPLHDPLLNIEVNNENSNIDISKLNKLIETINTAIVHEYKNENVKDSNPYAEFLNFYENIFKQAQQLGFIEPSTDKDKFMYILICNMLNDEFDLVTLQHFTTINKVRTYFNEQYKDDVFRSDLLKRLNNDEPLLKKEYICLLALYMLRRSSSIHLVFRINFNSIILQLVKNIINVIREINKKNQISTQNNEELNKILLSLERNFKLAKLQLVKKHQKIYDKAARLQLAEKNQNMLGRQVNRNNKDINTDSMQFFDKYVEKLENEKSKDFSSLSYILNKIYKYKYTQDFIKNMDAIILHVNIKQNVDDYIEIYNLIFNTAQQLGFIKPSTDRNTRNKFMYMLICNMLNENFSLDALEYFIQHSEVHKYLKLSDEYSPKQKDLINRLNKNETLQKKEYILLLSTIFVKRPVVMSKLNINYKNVILKLIYIIYANIANYFRTNRDKFNFELENKDNHEVGKKMVALLDITRQNIYSNLDNLIETYKSEIAKLTKENKEIKTNASHTNNFNNNNNIPIDENVNITDDIYNAYLSNNTKFTKFTPQKVNLSDDENNILQNNENVPNIFDKSSLLNNSLNKYSNINLSNSITQNLNLTIDSNQSNNLNKNNIISNSGFLSPIKYEHKNSKNIQPITTFNETTDKNDNMTLTQLPRPIINQIKNDDDNSNTTKNFEKLLQKKRKYDTINMFNLNLDKNFSNYNINNNKPSNIWKKFDDLNNNNDNPLKITNVLNRNIDMPTNMGNYGNDILTQNSNINYISLNQHNINNLVGNNFNIQWQNPNMNSTDYVNQNIFNKNIKNTKTSNTKIKNTKTSNTKNKKH